MRWATYLLSLEIIHVSLIGLFMLFLALYLPRRGEITRFLNKLAFIYIFFLLTIFSLSNAYLPLDKTLFNLFVDFFNISGFVESFNVLESQYLLVGSIWTDNLLFTKLFYIYALAITGIFLYGISDRFFVANSYEIEFTLLVFFTLVGGLFLFSVDNLIEFVLAIEIVTLATYALTAFDRTNRFSTYAGVQYFILGSIPSGLLVLGVTLLYMVLGSFGFSDITSLFIFPDLVETDKINTFYNKLLFPIFYYTPKFEGTFSMGDYLKDANWYASMLLYEGYSDNLFVRPTTFWLNFAEYYYHNMDAQVTLVAATRLFDYSFFEQEILYHRFIEAGIMPTHIFAQYPVEQSIPFYKSFFIELYPNNLYFSDINFFRKELVFDILVDNEEWITNKMSIDFLYWLSEKILYKYMYCIPTLDYIRLTDKSEFWLTIYNMWEYGFFSDYSIVIDENDIIRAMDTKTNLFTDVHAVAYDYINYPIYILAIFLIFFNLLFKITAAPFHFWAPSIYGKAPLASVTFLSIFSKAMILFAIAKFLMTIFNSFFNFFTPFLIFISVISVLFGMIGAFAEKGIKRFFVYSSMGHVGFMLIGLSLATEEGLSAAFHYLPVYIFTSFIMWFILMYLGEEKNHITHFAILKQENSMLALIFSLIIFSMSGIPPLGGFFVKLDVLAAILDSSLFYTNYIILFFTVASFFYYLRIVKIIFFDSSSENKEKLLKKTDVVEIKYNNINSFGTESKLLIIVVLFVILLFYMLLVEKPIIETQLECLKMVIYA